MANFAFGTKYFILSRFSSIPKTSTIEKARAQLMEEYSEYTRFGESEELKNHYELEKYLQSKEHIRLLNKLTEQRNAELDRIRIFGEQRKSKKFRNHFKFRESSALKTNQDFIGSVGFKEYQELKEKTASQEHTDRKVKATKQKKKLDDKLTRLEQLKKTAEVKSFLKGKLAEDGPNYPEVEEYKKLKTEVESEKFKESVALVDKDLGELRALESRYRHLMKSGPVKRAEKFGRSKKYLDFLAFEESKELADHIALKKYLGSEEHARLKQSVEEQLAAEQAKISQYEDFKKSKKFTWFTSLKGTHKFDPIKQWKLVFEDDFTGGFDTGKWMTRYLWGDKLIGDAYALEHDKAFPTDGNNIEVSNGTLKLITRKEKTEGKVWKPPFGFVPTGFDYTTGLISTAKSHQQLYGKIEAKLRINFAKPVNYNFWMASEKMVPHVDILKVSRKKSKAEVAHHAGSPDKKGEISNSRGEFSGLDLSQDFFIYTLIWSPERLTWQINGVTVHEQTAAIPKEPMYLVFSSAITGPVSDGSLPASMEIDWVRCYQQA